MIKRHLTDGENTAILTCVMEHKVMTPRILERELPWIKERGKGSAAAILCRYRRYISGNLSADDLRRSQPKPAVRYIRSLFSSLSPNHICGELKYAPKRVAKTEGNTPRKQSGAASKQTYDFASYIKEPLTQSVIFEYFKSQGCVIVNGVIRPERMPFGLFFSNDSRVSRNSKRPESAGRIAITRHWYDKAGALKGIIDEMAECKNIDMRVIEGAYVWRRFMQYRSIDDMKLDLETLNTLNSEFRKRCKLKNICW